MNLQLRVPGIVLGLSFFLPWANLLPVLQSDPCACIANPGEDDGQEGVLPTRYMTPVPGHDVPTLPVTPKINSSVSGECDFDECPGPETCSWNYTFTIITPPQSLAGELDHFTHRGVNYPANFGQDTVITRTKSGVECSNTYHSFLQAKNAQNQTIAAMSWDLECKQCTAAQ